MEQTEMGNGSEETVVSSAGAGDSVTEKAAEEVTEKAAEEAAEKKPEGEKAAEDGGESSSYRERQREKFEASKARKRALIEEAKALGTFTQWKEGMEKQKDLMERWKKAGYAAEEDETLWEKFKAARDVFFENRKKHFAQMDEQRKEAAEKKREIIERVKTMVFAPENYERDSETMDAIFEEWKKAGVADRKENDLLWEEFNKAREPFFEIRNEIHKQQDEEFRVKREKKQALIDECLKLLDSGDTGRENSERMKALTQEWKDIGFSGRTDSQELWDRFKEVQDKFWAVKKEKLDKKNEEAIKKLEEAISRRRKKIDFIKGHNSGMSPSRLSEQFLTRLTKDSEQIDDIQKEIKEITEKIEAIRQGKRIPRGTAKPARDNAEPASEAAEEERETAEVVSEAAEPESEGAEPVKGEGGN